MRQDGFRRVVLEFPDERGASLDALDLSIEQGEIDEMEANKLIQLLEESELPTVLNVAHSQMLLSAFAKALELGDFGLAPQQRSNIQGWINNFEPVN